MKKFLIQREPEPHFNAVPLKSDYCDVHLEHSKCLYSTPNTNCKILDHGLSQENQDKLVEKINE